MQLQQRKIFNPNGNDSKKAVVNADVTNLLQLNKIKYKDILSIDTVMDSNFWLPEKIDITSDKYCYHNKLQPEEREIFETIISFLIFLDSIQTSNIPTNLSGYFTASEIVAALTTQAYFEKIHSKSYQYILNSIFDDDSKKNEIYEKYKQYKPLADRTLYVGSWYQDFQDKKDSDSFLKALFANYILEGLYFYNSFIFFYNLAYKNMMVGTKDVIKKIQIDENLHVALFEKIIKHYISENNLQDKYDLLTEMVVEATYKEIEFMQEVIGNKVLGITDQTIEEYTKYLANQRLEVFGINLSFKGVTNPYKHLKNLSGDGDSTNKGNFFESNITAYNMSSAVGGWDDL